MNIDGSHISKVETCPKSQRYSHLFKDKRAFVGHVFNYEEEKKVQGRVWHSMSFIKQKKKKTNKVADLTHTGWRVLVLQGNGGGEPGSDQNS